MNNKENLINLKELSLWLGRFSPDTFPEYKKAAELLLRNKSIYIFEDELIERCRENDEVQRHIAFGTKPLEAIDTVFPDRFLREGLRVKDGNPESEIEWTFLDLWTDYDVVPQDIHYTVFFAYKLRSTNLLRFDEFLNYTLKNSFDDNLKNFIRFLTLTIRTEHGKKLLRPEQIQTIQEWIEDKEKETTLPAAERAIKTKGKPKRTRDDKYTLLNQEQTALLIHCLRNTRIIHTDEFLTNKEAGHAFAILTGYSEDTLRQNISEFEIKNLSTKKNAEAVINAAEELIKFVKDVIMRNKAGGSST